MSENGKQLNELTALLDRFAAESKHDMPGSLETYTVDRAESGKYTATAKFRPLKAG